MGRAACDFAEEEEGQEELESVAAQLFVGQALDGEDALAADELEAKAAGLACEDHGAAVGLEEDACELKQKNGMREE